MRARRLRTGVTWVEVLIVVAVLAVAIGVAIPFALRSREESRRETCALNMKVIGLAFQYHASAKNNRFPGSASLIESDGGKHVGGYSFLVALLPYMENNPLHDRLMSAFPGLEPDDPKNVPSAYTGPRKLDHDFRSKWW